MGLLTPIAIWLGSTTWMPKILPQVVWLDKSIHKLTRGRLTLVAIAGLPSAYLTVKGRKSGIERTTPLLCVPDGETILIAGSYFGAPKMPLWVGNLRAAGTARVQHRKETFEVAATELAGDAREEAWQVMLKTWPNYAKYEERVDRLIPVFRLVRV